MSTYVPYLANNGRAMSYSRTYINCVTGGGGGVYTCASLLDLFARGRELLGSLRVFGGGGSGNLAFRKGQRWA